MTIKAGDRLPDGTLTELIETETPGCTLGPNAFKVSDLVKGKRIVVFGLPGAFTPTCSAKHLPGFVNNAEELKKKGVEVIACLSVNDAFVMDAWGKAQNAGDKVIMLADGNADFAKATGLTMDGTGYGMGLRTSRWAMVLEDGKVKTLNIEAPGAFEVSSAEAVMKAL